MSDLREQLIRRAHKYVPFFISLEEAIGAIMPIIEAELQKRDREIERWHTECDKVSVPHDPEILVRHHRNNQAATTGAEAAIRRMKQDKLLEQTIEVLEGFLGDGPAQMWWRDQAKPLLDNLKTSQ